MKKRTVSAKMPVVLISRIDTYLLSHNCKSRSEVVRNRLERFLTIIKPLVNDIKIDSENISNDRIKNFSNVLEPKNLELIDEIVKLGIIKDRSECLRVALLLGELDDLLIT